jgi:Lon protease-like protein
MATIGVAAAYSTMNQKNMRATPLDLPNEAPVMVLPNAVLLPHTLLPLRIFEPQYRAMLRRCLERERLFCVAFRQPDAEDSAAANFLPIGGIGLVRACVGAEDGTSTLILQGLARVKFGSLVQTEPFRIAEIREFPSDCPNLVEAEALGAKVVEICGKLHAEGLELPAALLERLRHVTDPELLADIVTQSFVREPAQQQRLLEEASVSERMRLLIRYLQG